MQRYRFVVVDAAGAVKRGTLNAASPSEAVTRLERSGYEVRELEPDGPSGAARSAMDLPSDEDDEPTRACRPGRGGSVLTLILSVAALLLGGTALGITLFRKPPEPPPAESPLGKGLSAYDFKTPEAAVRSMAEIEKNRDIKAELDLGDLRNRRAGEEKARTLEIARTADYKDYKVVFISYTRKGKKVKRVESFTKDLESKLWVPKYVSPFDVRKTNEALGKDMEEWRTKDADDD